MIIPYLCNEYNLMPNQFIQFCRNNGYPIKEPKGIFGGDYEIPDEYVTEAVAAYKNSIHRSSTRVKPTYDPNTYSVDEAKLAENREKCAALTAMSVTSCNSFQGYRIVRYADYLACDSVFEFARGSYGYFTGASLDVGAALTSSLRRGRRDAMQELKEAAHDLGCNAIVGVSYSYNTLIPETGSKGEQVYLPYVFCVTVSGTAVEIQQEESR